MIAVTNSDLPNQKYRFPPIDKFIALSFAILVLLLGYGLIVKGVSGVYHDDGIYLVTAKAIAQGEGYRLIHLPGSPIQTKYPFLYPAILALVWRGFPSFPANLIWMQLLSLLAGAATAALAYLYLIRFRYAPRIIAGGALLMCGTSPQLLYFSSSCLSEMPFALLLVAAMWGLERQIEKPFNSRVIQFLLGILLVLPLFCRTIGLVAVFLVIVLAFRHRRILLWPVAGVAAAVLPFASWTFVSSKWAGGVSSHVYYTNYVRWWGAYGVSFIGRVLKSNVLDVLVSFTPVSQLRWLNTSGWFEWCMAAIGFIALVTMVRQVGSSRILPSFLLGYLIVVLVWPWPPQRFLVPVLPYLFVYSLTLVSGILKKPSWSLKLPVHGLIAILVILNLKTVMCDIAESKANRYPAYMQLDSAPVRWPSFEHMFNWINMNTGAKDVFVSGMDPMLYLYTGRRAARPFAARPDAMFYKDSSTPVLGPMSEMMENIRYYGAQYLVSSPMPGFPEEGAYAKFVVEAQRKYPGWLELAYQGKDKRFLVWKIKYFPS